MAISTEKVALGSLLAQSLQGVASSLIAKVKLLSGWIPMMESKGAVTLIVAAQRASTTGLIDQDTLLFLPRTIN